MVAIDATTGQVRWWYQMVHHDLWDYDCPNATMLFDVPIGGVMRQGIGEACKTGWLYLLDRNTGKPLIGIVEKKVPQSKAQNTWPTQPIPVGDRINPQTCALKKNYKKPFAGKPVKVGCLWDPPALDRAVASAPSAQGGVDWNPSAYNPDTHYAYICAAARRLRYPGHSRREAERGLPRGQVAGRRELRRDHVQPGLHRRDGRDDEQGRLAREMATNVLQRNLHDRGWAAVCRPRDRGDRRVRREDRQRAGRDFMLAANVAAPGMTYSVNGKQYIAIYDGGTAFTFESPGKHGDDVYAFALP